MDDNLQHYSKLEEGAVNVLCPPNVVGMMTGTYRASQQRNGNVTLLYRDGTTKTAKSDTDIMDFPDYFSVVAYVQDKR